MMVRLLHYVRNDGFTTFAMTASYFAMADLRRSNNTTLQEPTLRTFMKFFLQCLKIKTASIILRRFYFDEAHLFSQTFTT